MIVKNHNIVLEDTSPAEMARFRQIFKGIWLQQVEDEKNAVEMEKYIKNSQTGTVNNTFIPVTQVIQIINKFQGEAHPHKTFVDLIDRNFCQPDNKELVAYTDSQGMPREGTIELNWNPFVGIDLRVPSWDINFETGVFHTRFSIKIYEFNSHNIAFEFVVNDYDLLLHLFKLLKIHLEQENVKKLITLYQAKIANAKNDPNKLDVVYETLPNTLYGHIDDVVLYEHLNLILDSVKFSDYTNYIFGGTNEDKAVLNILYAIKNKAELYRKLYEDSQLLYKIYTKLHGEEIQDLLRFLTRLVEEFDKTKPTDIVYFDNTYYLFRDTHVKTNWSGTTITVNNYKDKTELVGTPRAAQNPKELDKMYPPGVQEVYLPKYYILNKSFNPLSKLNFGTKLGELGEQLGDDNTFVIALKLHNMATKQSNWDLFNIATDLLSLLSGAGALRIVLAKGAPVAARILAGVVLAKDATHYAMLSNNTLQKWHDNGYGWLANLWVAFSVTADLASFGLPNLSKIAREGNAAAELAETAEEAKEIKKVADRANDYVKAETGKDVSKMSEKQYKKFLEKLQDKEELIDKQLKPTYEKGFEHYKARTPKLSKIPENIKRQAKLLTRKVDDEVKELYEIENVSGKSEGKKIVIDKNGKKIVDKKWLEDRTLVAGMIHQDKKLGEIIITKTNFPKSEMKDFLALKNWARDEVDLEGIKKIYKMFKDKKYLEFDMHPYIEKLLKTHFSEIKKGIKYPPSYEWGRTGGLPGTHAEVLALNDLLWTLQGKGIKLTDEVLSGFMGYNKRILDESYMIRCGDCQLILKDVLFLEKIEK